MSPFLLLQLSVLILANKANVENTVFVQSAPGENTDLFGASHQFVFPTTKGRIFMEIRAEKEPLFARKIKVCLSSQQNKCVVIISSRISLDWN